MQIKYLSSNIYRLCNYTLRQEKLENYRKLYEKQVRDWQLLKIRGVSDMECQAILGFSRAKYYRDKNKLHKLSLGIMPPSKRPKNLRQSKISSIIKQQILHIRRENPTYGKEKISVILKRDYDIDLSVSSVGRILKYYMDKGIIQRSRSALRAKRKRSFTKHAKPWQYGMKAKKPGELVQIDHASVTKNQITVKHFQAWDPVTKTIVAEAYSNATSHTAKKFLAKVVAEMPFAITSIQVDGGSEFMKHFEEECQKLNIKLFVLPPKKPQWNGGVERGNRTFKEEFYYRGDLLADSIGAMKVELKKAVEKYNTYRPHFNLKGLTPWEYTKTILKAA